jgi:radical SAM superfamily enzyme YgiQ (UPF0313 family)
VIVFDPGGRPLRATWEGALYHRGLDGRILELRRRGDDLDHYHDTRRLGPQEAERWLERAGSGRADYPTWRDFLAEDERAFARLYGGLGIIPPDCGRCLLLVLTEGCAYNRCRFCTFYRDTAFRARPLGEVREHLREVLARLGPALEARRGVFLGGAGAAGLSTQRLLAALQAVREHLPCPLRDAHGRPRHPQDFERVAAFKDVFLGEPRSDGEWRELAAAGLARVYMGIESGSPRVLEHLGKPVDLARARREVESLKRAGLQVGPIFLLGAGGPERAADHLAGTVSWLRAVELDAGDKVYLSPLVGSGGLDGAACRAQGRELRRRLGWPAPPRGPAVSLYDIRQFLI